jgi:hypothetical protein
MRRYNWASGFRGIFGVATVVWSLQSGVLAQSKALAKPPIAQGHASTEATPSGSGIYAVGAGDIAGCRALTVWRYRRHHPSPQHLLISVPPRRASAEAAPSASGFAGSPQFVRPSMNLKRPTLLR